MTSSAIGGTLTLSAYSTALFSTWWMVEEFALLLDCGDGASAALLQKSRKVRTIAMSHSDRDHLAGLPQFLQLNVRDGGLPKVLYPRDCDSFSVLRDFSHRFDRFHLEAGQGNEWLPMAPGDSLPLGKANAWISPVRNRHIEVEEALVKSVGYRVRRETQHLKPEYQGRPGEEIARLREQLGEQKIMEHQAETLLAYSGDTPIEEAAYWGSTSLLIHEATFLTAAEMERLGQDLRHSALDQVLPLAAELSPEALVLGHFSTRYTRRQIREAITRLCDRLRPRFPVFAVMPGEIRRDLLRSRPIWEP